MDAVKRCCIAAELAGLVLFSGKVKNNSIRISTESAAVAKRLVMLSERYFNLSPEIEYGKNSCGCTLPINKITGKIYLSDSYLTDNPTINPKIIEKDCCRNAFLRGAFLGGGTVIDPNKNYNLEFLTASKALCDDLESLMSKLGLEFKRAKRHTSYVLYAKNSELICDTLTHIGAFNAQMEILNIKIERELRNDLNRAANGETANMDKVITAAAQQIRAIETIEKTIGLENLPDELREVAQLRSRNKDLSLEQLGKKLTPQLSKSGVNHRLKKIIDIADNIHGKG